MPKEEVPSGTAVRDCPPSIHATAARTSENRRSRPVRRRVVKESHEHRVPVSRLLVLSDRREVGKRPSAVPCGRERTEYQNSADRRDRLYVGPERMREIRCGAADGPPTVSPAGRRGNAASEARSSWSGLPVGENMSQNVRSPGDRGDSAARPRQDDDGRASVLRSGQDWFRQMRTVESCGED